MDFGGQQLVDCGGLTTCGLRWTFNLWIAVGLLFLDRSGSSTCPLCGSLTCGL